MRLITDRLLIQPVSPELNQAAIKQGYFKGHIELYLNELEKDPNQLNWGPWFVMLKESGHIIGDIGFKGRPNEERIAEIGYGFLEKYHNQGYATESVRALIDWAFETDEADILVAETANDNIASIKVLEKLGMQRIHEANGMIYWQLLKDGIDKGMINEKDGEAEKEI